MVAVPLETPVTPPVADIEPMPGSTLLQVPPVVISVSEMAEPTQTLSGPVMKSGRGFMVTMVVATQPDARVYVMVTVMVTVVNPDVIKPVDKPTAKAAGELLSQVPPVTTSVRAPVEFPQITRSPVMAPGMG
jgi:hypothetical protein